MILAQEEHSMSVGVEFSPKGLPSPHTAHTAELGKPGYTQHEKREKEINALCNNLTASI